MARARGVAATTSLWQPRRQVRVVVATTSLGGSPEAGQMGNREAGWKGGAGVSGEVLTLTPKETHQWTIGVARAAAMDHWCRYVPHDAPGRADLEGVRAMWEVLRV